LLLVVPRAFTITAASFERTLRRAKLLICFKFKRLDMSRRSVSGVAVLLLWAVLCAPAFVASLDPRMAHDDLTGGSVSECIGCHTMAAPDHPVEIAAGFQDTLPLGGGRVTCITCHDCTQDTCPIRLQREEMCQVCHDCSQGMACLIGTAHMGSAANIKIQIKDCEACHDGMLAGSVGGPQGHVDVYYMAGRDFNAALDHRVILVDGRVTCISCHDPYSSEPKRLVMSNHRSRLCLECHRK
jgi:predicted CXXCH cytochrome family protein